MNNMNDKETDMKLHDEQHEELKKNDAATHADDEKKKIKSALESMMFVWGSPLPAATAAEALGITKAYAVKCLKELRDEYEERGSGLTVREINGRFQFCTVPENELYISNLCAPVKSKRLSSAAMEVLTIVAYRQPVSRSEIEFVRGLKSENVLYGLQKKGLIMEKGRGTGLGRPILFGTTDLFLEKFGISSLDELPEIEDPEYFAETPPAGDGEEYDSYADAVQELDI